MTPVHRIAKDMSEDAMIQKMTRDTYAKLLKNEEEARERAIALTATVTMHKLKCAHCGAEFEHANKNVITCSEACRKARKRNQDIRCKAGKGRTGHMGKCAYCGKEYLIQGTTQRYCSNKCRKGQENRQKRLNARTLKTTCIICGQEFMTSVNTKAKTCGGACLQTYKAFLTRERFKTQREIGADNMLDSMPCPWATGKLDTLPVGVTSWDCADMDPLGCGTAMVMLDVGEMKQRRRAA